MTAELQPLVDLAANENIAISTLSTMLYCSIGAIVALFGFIIYLIKKCDASQKEAWAHVSKFSEAIKSFSKEVTYALGRQDANGDRANQGGRRRNSDGP